MNAPIDPLEVARAIIADPRKKYTMSTLEIIEICKALVATDEEPVPMISNELADAARAMISAGDNLSEAAQQGGVHPAGDTVRASFLTFKNLFQSEFPDVRHD